MSMYYHLREQVLQEFFSKRSDFPGKRPKRDSFVFPVLQKTHQDKISSRIQVSLAEWISFEVSVLLQLNTATLSEVGVPAVSDTYFFL